MWFCLVCIDYKLIFLAYSSSLTQNSLIWVFITVSDLSIWNVYTCSRHWMKKGKEEPRLPSVASIMFVWIIVHDGKEEK